MLSWWQGHGDSERWCNIGRKWWSQGWNPKQPPPAMSAPLCGTDIGTESAEECAFWPLRTSEHNGGSSLNSWSSRLVSMDMEFHNWINSYYKSCQEMEADSLEEPWITLFLYGILIQGPRPEPLDRTFCTDGNIQYLCFPMAATMHKWPLSPWNVASVAKELNFN